MVLGGQSPDYACWAWFHAEICFKEILLKPYHVMSPHSSSHVLWFRASRQNKILEMHPLLFITFDPWSEYIKNKILKFSDIVLGRSPKITKKKICVS